MYNARAELLYMACTYLQLYYCRRRRGFFTRSPLAIAFERSCLSILILSGPYLVEPEAVQSLQLN